MEEISQQLEDEYGAPAWLFTRSATARAKASGATAESVLRSWVEGASGEPAPVAAAVEAADPDGAGDGPAPAEGVNQGLEGDALLAAVAEARGMPASLISRSAKARASAIGGSIDDVLREWAVEDGLTPVPVATPPPAPASDAAVVSDDGGGAEPIAEKSQVATIGLSGAALLAAVVEARGLPESMVERSASARAKTIGVPLDDVLREWAEDEGLDVGEAPATPAAEAVPAPAAAVVEAIAAARAASSANNLAT